MREFLKLLMSAMNVHKPILALPSAIAYAAALACEAFQEVPLVSKDQVQLSLSDNICSRNALQSDLGIEPTALEIALATYKESPDKVVTGAQN